MDIRLPLGMLFSIVGALLAGFGVATASSQMYRQHSLGINVNLWSGLGMLAFGVTLLWLARRVTSPSATHPRRTS